MNENEGENKNIHININDPAREEETDYADTEKKKPSLLKKLFKIFAVSVILAVYIIFSIRLFVSCDSPIVDDILKTPEITAAYEASPETFEIRQYEITNWYESKNPASDEDSDMGGKLLSVANLYYIPETHDLQITVKFNLDILPDRETEYSAELLPFELYLEDETLAHYTDITSAAYDERYSFGYLRVNFSGIEFEKTDGTLDEDGDPARKNYELYLKRRNTDGTYSDYESFSIYTGSKYFKNVSYK